jgi:hypothetical protein
MCKPYGTDFDSIGHDIPKRAQKQSAFGGCHVLDGWYLVCAHQPGLAGTDHAPSRNLPTARSTSSVSSHETATKLAMM